MIKHLAQISNPVLPQIIGGPGNNYEGGGAGLGKLISSIVGALFIAGFLLAFFMVIQGALKWIAAGGDKTKLESARDAITNSLIGIILVGATYAIAVLMSGFFGLDLGKLPIPSITQ